MKRSPVHDDVLGRLEWDSVLDQLSTEIRLASGHSVQLNIEAPNNEIIESHMDFARTAVDRFSQNEFLYRQQTAANLLECFNDVWNEGEPITVDSLTAELELESITVLSPLGLEANYLPKDEWMFGGHFVVSCINEDDSVTDTHLVG